MSIHANNIDPIDVKKEIKEAIKLTNEGTTKKALNRALQLIKAYEEALKRQQELTAKAISKIRQLSNSELT